MVREELGITDSTSPDVAISNAQEDFVQKT